MNVSSVPTEAELRAFIGPRADRYWRKWRWAIERGNWSGGALWPPFFFSVVWFAYRRMYRALWIPVALVAVVAFAQGAFEATRETSTGSPYTTPREIDGIINVALALATSWIGNGLYLRKLRKEVVEVRAMGLAPDAALERLRERGGTNTTAAIIGGTILAVLAAVALAS